jgi:hypothetical protein
LTQELEDKWERQECPWILALENTLEAIEGEIHKLNIHIHNKTISLQV